MKKEGRFFFDLQFVLDLVHDVVQVFIVVVVKISEFVIILKILVNILEN